jgi:hypothetical protein
MIGLDLFFFERDRFLLLAPSRMCFYLYVFLAAAQLFPYLTAAFASILKLRLSAHR